MYVYIYIYIHTYVYTHKHTHTCMQSTKAAEEGVLNVKGLIKHGLQNIRKYVLDISLSS